MLYMILGYDHADSLPRRKACRPEHIARVQELRDAGRVILVGPLPNVDGTDPGEAGFAGSLLVLEFSDIAAARDWAGADAYVRERVWQRVEVLPFIKVG